ncbi:hypothetical protein [Bradyrhizobium sp. 2TAF24]|uniref:hypothetical protein n=1 Tax=Bradyrhizobium sp. 2TAF24 TaxID=3233011 RepID=UPI003F90E596
MRLLLGTVICIALATCAGATEQGGSSAAPASLSEAYSQTQAAGVPNAHVRTAPTPSSGSDRPWTGMHVGVDVGAAK